MSRIHEALRRAEQQEAVPAVESVEEPISLAGMPDSQVIAKAYGDDEATADMGPGLEGALQRCSRPAWHPNRETMLFFDGAEQPAERYQASEQFRTLRPRAGAKPARAFSFFDVEGEDEPDETVDLIGMAGKKG